MNDPAAPDLQHPNCVISYDGAGDFSTRGQKLLGRQSANEGFLRGWLHHGGVDRFYCLSRFKAQAEEFAQLAQGLLGERAEGKTFRWYSPQNMTPIATVGSVFLPAPQVAAHAWKRRRHPGLPPSAFSLVGMTHTTCELGILDWLADMLVAPVQPWDAQICPSAGVKRMIERLLDAEEDFLREHLGATRSTRPRLPVLPLGIHCDDFAPDPALRQRWRERLSLGDDTVAVLYVGRFDLFNKANLLPLFEALEHAAERARAPLALVLAGWFESPFHESAIRQGLEPLAKTMPVHVLDGRAADVRAGVWRAADVFASLVDNVQETFGLTPIEAMAAGLPCVVSDYDGYRESVRDGVDGFRIPTLQAPAGCGQDLINRHDDRLDDYRHYFGRLSWFVSVDVRRAADAFVALADDPDLRRRMGEAGRSRARADYDWSVIIPRFQSLLAELAALRRAADSPPPALPAHLLHPRRADPFHLFSHYPTATLDDASRLTVTGNPRDLGRLLCLPVYAFGGPRVLDEALLGDVLRWLARPAGATVAEVIAQFAPRATAAGLRRQLVWLHKVGLIDVAPPGP